MFFSLEYPNYLFLFSFTPSQESNTLFNYNTSIRIIKEGIFEKDALKFNGEMQKDIYLTILNPTKRS